MKPTITHRLTILIFAALLLTACLGQPSGPPSGDTLLTGKVIYKGMGVEEAVVIVTEGGKAVARTTSAYHGTFRIYLPEGSYALTASWTLPDNRSEDKPLTGTLREVIIPAGTTRLDQLSITLGE